MLIMLLWAFPVIGNKNHYGNKSLIHISRSFLMSDAKVTSLIEYGKVKR